MRVIILASLLSLLYAVPAATETEWRTDTSPKYDAMCLTGVLAGDPFYTRYYQAQLEELRLPPDLDGL